MLENDIKEFIIKTLNLEDITPEEIVSDEPLFYEGLGLDSLDALELSVAISKKYNVSIDNNPEENQKIFRSVASILTFLKEHGYE